MNLTTQMMQSEWMKALGWTFVHSLWQIALIGLLLYVVLRLIPTRNAHKRYTFSTLSLWMVVVMTLSTFIIMLPDSRNFSEVLGKITFLQASSAAAPGLMERISSWLEIHMPMMLTIWIGGVMILMLRLAVSMAWVRHMKATSIPDSGIQMNMNHIIQRLRLNIKPLVSQSEWVPSPVTIGHVKPMILFPIGIINQLTPKEVEAILTHELAHIVRRDYLSNLIQSFIETLFYYHPVTWWISRMVRIERENRADDLAVSWCGDHLGYAKTLMTVQEMQIQSAPNLAIGFANRKGVMLARIQRILHLPYKNHNQMEKTVLLSLCSLVFLAFTLTSHTSKADQPDKVTAMPSLFSFAEEKTDSLPAKGIYRIHKKTDNQDISIAVEDGNITELKIDGKEIQPSEFEAYDQVIEDLFGNMDEHPSMNGFGFTMPAIPGIPPVPSIPGIPDIPGIPTIPDIAPFMYDFEFGMPTMPPMPEIDFEQLFNEHNLKWSGDMDNLLQLHGLENFEILGDSLPDGKGSRMIIIVNGDSIIHNIPNWDSSDFYGYMQDENLKRGYEKEWKEQWKSEAEQWRTQSDEWHQQQQELRSHLREESDQRRAEQDLLRERLRGQYSRDQDHQKEIERELRLLTPAQPYIYEHRAPRLSISDELVSDGLIKSGEEVEVVLTPDKLKIKGQKMPDAIHQKYLRIYEDQQGIKLSDNSKVAFTTKSKQRM